MCILRLRCLQTLGVLLAGLLLASACDNATKKTGDNNKTAKESTTHKDTPKNDAPSKDGDPPRKDATPADSNAIKAEPDHVHAAPIRLNANAIKRVIRIQQPALRACYEQARAADDSLAGKVVASFKINADGRVADLSIKEQDLNNDDFNTCFTTTLSALTFPPHNSDPVEVTYPFQFNASDPTPSHVKMAFAFDPVPLSATTPQHNADLIRAAISTLRPAIRACYEARLKAHQDGLLTGSITVAFELNAKGAADKVSIQASALKLNAVAGAKDIKDDTLETCLLEQVKQLEVAGLQDPPAKVTYPFVFEASPSDAQPRANAPVTIPDNAAGVTQKLSKDDIRGTIRDHQAEVRACYEIALANDPTLAGDITTTFTIQATGAVADATISKHTFADDTVPNCVLTALKTWIFPAHAAGGTTRVTYPFSFSPK